MDYKYIYLGDPIYFSLQIGKRITKGELFNSKKGKYPIYSANVHQEFGWGSNLLNKLSFSSSSVIWGIDGNWQCRYIAEDNPFIPTDHCGVLQTVSTTINMRYVNIVLNIEGQKIGFSRSYRASLENMRNIAIPIPILPSGEIDLSAQINIADKNDKYTTLQNRIKQYIHQLQNISVDIDNDDYNYKLINILDIFKPQRGISKYTHKYGHNNSGNYPVYSASTRAPLTFINTYDYNGRYLTWTTNGYGGYIFILSGKFSINGDRALLIPKTNLINIDYIRFIAQPYFRVLAKTKGRVIEGKKNEFTKLQPQMLENLQIPIPIDNNGDFDLQIQQAIAKKYTTIEQMKLKAIDALKRIIESTIKITE